MKLPREVPVMTLPNATLFPQALLPLYIFEPRYRHMLADALHSNRMFSVAMQKPGTEREAPSPVAGLGSKMGMDATNKWPGETQREWGRPIHMDADVTTRVQRLCEDLGC